MSHEIIYDDSYLRKDNSPRSFDLTDSQISGLCSNSSRIENDNSTIKSSSSSTNDKNSESWNDKFEDKPGPLNNKLKSPIKKSDSINYDSTDYNSESTDIKSESNNFESSINNNESNNFESSSNDYKNASNDYKFESSTKGSDDYKFDSFDDKPKNLKVKDVKLKDAKLKPTLATPNKVAIKKSSPPKIKPNDKSGRFHIPNILPSHAGPFVYDREEKVIRYNFERCVSEDSTVFFGGKKGNFVFDPVNRTLMVGVDNKLHNCTDSSTINCRGVKLRNCKDTVAIGINATDEDEFPENLDETLLVRNLYVAGNLSASNVKQNSVYVQGNNQRDVYHQITRGDGIDIIYTNSIEGTIWIQLGVPNDSRFEANRTIVIKDVTLETGQTSAYNTNIVVPPAHNGISQTKIEYYNGKLLAVSSDRLTGYVLNTAGGSVTYRYVEPFMPGQSATWVIQQQFLGNCRVNPFPDASEQTRSKLIKKY